MKNLSSFFIVNPKLTAVLTMFLILFGFMGIKKMNALTITVPTLSNASQMQIIGRSERKKRLK